MTVHVESMDRSWINFNQTSSEYLRGVDEFAAVASVMLYMYDIIMHYRYSLDISEVFAFLYPYLSVFLYTI